MAADKQICPWSIQVSNTQPVNKLIQPRDRHDDPPDCEAIGMKGERIGIEVTELVDGPSIAAAKNSESAHDNIFLPEQVTEEVTSIIRKKDKAVLKGGPYEQYILIIYCDDPRYLDTENLNALRNHHFPETSLIDRVFFLESYCPSQQCCPHIELRLKKKSP